MLSCKQPERPWVLTSISPYPCRFRAFRFMQMLCPSPPACCQLQEEEVRTHHADPTEEEAQVDSGDAGRRTQYRRKTTLYLLFGAFSLLAQASDADGLSSLRKMIVECALCTVWPLDPFQSRGREF